MKTKLQSICLFKTFFFVLILSACSSKPVLYPNATYERAGRDQADRDIQECMDKADEFLKSDEGKRILQGAGRGSAVGGAVGAVSGLLRGNVVRGAAEGAAFGGTAGAAATAVSPNQLKQRFVNRCLAEKGYEVTGWR